MPDQWIRRPGGARDIGIGAEGSGWVIGTDPDHPYPITPGTVDYGIHRWTGSTWETIEGGAALGIAVDQTGNPWVVNHRYEIYRRINNQWEHMPGLARDIGIGASGSVWVIGTNAVGPASPDHPANDLGIYRWTGSTWEPIDGGGIRIAVDQNGNPWVRNYNREIYRRINNQWEHIPGLAYDIGIGADGSVWVIGTDPVGPDQHPDHGVHRWTGSTWERIDGGGVAISVGVDGLPWIVNREGLIFQRVR